MILYHDLAGWAYLVEKLATAVPKELVESHLNLEGRYLKGEMVVGQG